MEAKFKDKLKNTGKSITPQRLAVFKYLQKHDPTTVGAVIRHYQDQYDQASIYRTIALFRELSVIQDAIISGQKMIELTDTYDSHHHHISCQSCGKSVSIEDPALEVRLDELARAHGIRPMSHQIDVTGLCRDCANGLGG